MALTWREETLVAIALLGGKRGGRICWFPISTNGTEHLLVSPPLRMSWFLKFVDKSLKFDILNETEGLWEWVCGWILIFSPIVPSRVTCHHKHVSTCRWEHLTKTCCLLVKVLLACHSPGFSGKVWDHSLHDNSCLPQDMRLWCLWILDLQLGSTSKKSHEASSKEKKPTAETTLVYKLLTTSGFSTEDASETTASGMVINTHLFK